MDSSYYADADADNETEGSAVESIEEVTKQK
jgi:hypothetical protein